MRDLVQKAVEVAEARAAELDEDVAELRAKCVELEEARLKARALPPDTTASPAHSLRVRSPMRDDPCRASCGGRSHLRVSRAVCELHRVMWLP